MPDVVPVRRQKVEHAFGEDWMELCHLLTCQLPTSKPHPRLKRVTAILGAPISMSRLNPQIMWAPRGKRCRTGLTDLDRDRLPAAGSKMEIEGYAYREYGADSRDDLTDGG
ncbi:hypothetical protein [Mesorhizobium waimense]|uniref:hypothetical protein n=1 Tax=Mesorhizobium waimense TaxID=1300307 RepID=UPI0011C44CCE|nr:hypothetical protein [Mesorhizobium waimense]